MNESGLVTTTMQSKASKCASPDRRHPIGAGFLLQYVLDTRGSVQDAIRAFSQVMPWKDECTDHFLVADSTGNCAGFEFLNGEFVCHTGDELPIKAMTNMRYERARPAYERGGPHRR